MELKRSIRAIIEAEEQPKPTGHSSSVAQDGGGSQDMADVSERAKCIAAKIVRLEADTVTTTAGNVRSYLSISDRLSFSIELSLTASVALFTR